MRKEEYLIEYPIYLLLLLFCFYYILKKGYQNTKDVAINKVKIHDDSLILSTHIKDIAAFRHAFGKYIDFPIANCIEKLKDEPIDLIALTGDYLDRKWTIPKLGPYLEVINKLNAKVRDICGVRKP